MKLKSHFRHFLEADPERLHFAAHSHHLWPDVTLAAQERCWRDAARLADRKWDMIFGELYPETQRQVAELLSLPRPASLAFGPNRGERLTSLARTAWASARFFPAINARAWASIARCPSYVPASFG